MLAERVKRANEAAVPPSVPVQQLSFRAPSHTEPELLRQRVVAAELAANKNDSACDRLNARVEGLDTRMADMLINMSKASWPL